MKLNGTEVERGADDDTSHSPTTLLIAAGITLAFLGYLSLVFHTIWNWFLIYRFGPISYPTSIGIMVLWHILHHATAPIYSRGVKASSIQAILVKTLYVTAILVVAAIIYAMLMAPAMFAPVGSRP